MRDVDEHRRRPDELAVMWSLEPTMQEVIVEGASDVALLQWCFSELFPAVNLKVYALSERVMVEDVSAVHEDGARGSNRGRLIAAAIAVEQKNPTQRSGAFVADRDHESVGLDRCPEVQNLFFTDFTAMELYSYNQRSLDRILSVALRAPRECTAKIVMDATTPVLVELFRFRSILRSIPPPTPSIAKSVIQSLWSGGAKSAPFDAVEAFRRSCTGNTDELVVKYDQLQVLDGKDLRHYIRGHDIAPVLIQYLKSRHGHLFNNDRKKYQNAEIFEAFLALTVEPSEMAQTSLVRELVCFLGIADSVDIISMPRQANPIEGQCVEDAGKR